MGADTKCPTHCCHSCLWTQKSNAKEAERSRCVVLSTNRPKHDGRLLPRAAAAAMAVTAVNESVSHSNNNNSPESGRRAIIVVFAFPQQTDSSAQSVSPYLQELVPTGLSVCLSVCRWPSSSSIPLRQAVIAIFQFPIKHAQNMSRASM